MCSDTWVWSVAEKMIANGRLKYLEQVTLPNSSLFTINRTWTALKLNPVLCNENPDSDRPNFDTTSA
jgi:hypothetical protein